MQFNQKFDSNVHQFILIYFAVVHDHTVYGLDWDDSSYCCMANES